MLVRKNTALVTGYIMLLATLGVLAYMADAKYGFNKFHTKKSTSNHVFMSELGYVDLPRINLTMTSQDTGKTGRMTLDIALEVSQKNRERLSDYQPVITDRLLAYTRRQDVNSLRDPVNQRIFRNGLVEEAQHMQLPVPIMDIVVKRLLIL